MGFSDSFPIHNSDGTKQFRSDNFKKMFGVIFCMMLERDAYLSSALANLAMGGKIHHTKHFHFSVSAVSRCFSQVPNCFYESFQL